jgi:hypothetical protein
MNDYLVLLFQIIIATILVIFPAVVLGLEHHYWLVAIVFVAVFYLVQCGLDADVFNRAFAGPENMTADGDARHMMKDNLNKGGVLVEDGVFGDVSENYYGTRVPIMGPYDGVRPGDIQKKLGTAEYQKTAYPYRPMTNFGTMTPGDAVIGQKLIGEPVTEVAGTWYKQDVERWYPNTNRLATNTRDCTNYPAGHPGSCLIRSELIPSTPEAKAYPSIAGPYPAIPEALATLNGYSVDGRLLDEELAAKEERFSDIASTPKLIKSGEPWPALFKNAPGVMQFDTGVNPSPVIGQLGGPGPLCRNCKVGGCMKAYCGSRPLEPGNDNIISPAGYLADYLRDVALV